MKENKRDTMATINAHISKSMYGNSNLNHVFEIVANESGILEEEMEGKSRKREVVFARQLYCYYAITLVKGERPTPSLATIGSIIKKDHATVIYSKRNIDNLIQTNKAIRNRVLDTRGKIELKLHKLPTGLIIKVHDPLNIYVLEEINKTQNDIPLFNMEETQVLMSNESKRIKTGLTVMIPEGHRGEIHSCHEIEMLSEGENEIIVNVKNDNDLPIMIDNKVWIGKLIISKQEPIVLINIDLV